jgi:hypothetical protein
VARVFLPPYFRQAASLTLAMQGERPGWNNYKISICLPFPSEIRNLLIAGCFPCGCLNTESTICGNVVLLSAFHRRSNCGFILPQLNDKQDIFDDFTRNNDIMLRRTLWSEREYTSANWNHKSLPPFCFKLVDAAVGRSLHLRFC